MDTALITILISSLFSVLVAIITAFLSSTLYVRQVRADLQKEYESRFNERKWQTYTEFASLVVGIFADVKNNRQLNQKKITSDLYRFTGSLWIVGSEKVIDAYIDWQDFSRRVVQGQTTDINFSSLQKLAQIVVEMRRDLGYINDKATAMDLLATFFTDIDKDIPT